MLSDVTHALPYILTSYLITNHILSPSQYAYRPSHSTEDAVLDIVEWAAWSVDVGEVASRTSIDLSKAFDSIDHQLLLNKLGWYGISSPWFSSYLSSRSQLIRGRFHSGASSFPWRPSGLHCRPHPLPHLRQ